MLRRVQIVSVILALVLGLVAFSAPASAQTCDTSGTVNGSATPVAGVTGDTIVFVATGFTVGEDVSFWFTSPNGVVVGTAQPIPGGVNPDGSVGPLPWRIGEFPVLPTLFGEGRWALTFQGASSNNTSVIYFCVGFRVQPTATPAPPTSTPVPPTATTVAASPTAQATATTAATAAATETVAVAATPTTAVVETPTAVVETPVPVATVMPVETPTPVTVGMPRTGQGEAGPSPLLLFGLAGLCLLLAGLGARRLMAER